MKSLYKLYEEDLYVCPLCKTAGSPALHFALIFTNKKPHVKCLVCNHAGNRLNFLARGETTGETTKAELPEEAPGTMRHVPTKVRMVSKGDVLKEWFGQEVAVEGATMDIEGNFYVEVRFVPTDGTLWLINPDEYEVVESELKNVKQFSVMDLHPKGGDMAKPKDESTETLDRCIKCGRAFVYTEEKEAGVCDVCDKSITAKSRTLMPKAPFWKGWGGNDYETGVWRRKGKCQHCKKAEAEAGAIIRIPQEMWDWALDLVQAHDEEIMLCPSFAVAQEAEDGTPVYTLVPSPKTESAIAIDAVKNLLNWTETPEFAPLAKSLKKAILSLEEAQKAAAEMPDSIVIPPQFTSSGYCRRMNREEAEKHDIPWQEEYEGHFSGVRIHSHVDMGVFHSSTDAGSIDANNDVSIVMNKRGHVSAMARITVAECGHRVPVPAKVFLLGDGGRNEWIVSGRNRCRKEAYDVRWGKRVGGGGSDYGYYEGYYSKREVKGKGPKHMKAGDFDF